jgi:hypothetical protein
MNGIPDDESTVHGKIEYDIDCAWFDEHPNRTCRVRPALPHEPRDSTPGWRSWAIIWRPERGIHFKVMWFAHWSVQPPATNAGALRLLESFADGRKGLATPLYLAEIA